MGDGKSIALELKENLEAIKLRLEFEDYFSSEKKMVSENNKMFDFLGVAPIISKSSHKKINPDNLATLIENLEEVKASLKGSDLYKYIEM